MWMPILLATVIALAASPARATPTRLAVVALEAPPELTFMGKSAAEAFAREAAKDGSLVVTTPSGIEEKLGRVGSRELVRCGDDSRCLAAKGKALGVDRIVGGWLRKRGEVYRIGLVNADAATGREIGLAAREIPVASRRLQREVAAAAPGLLAGERDAKGTLVVVTDVPGAEVTIDDLGAGTTPVTRAVSPGRHKVHVAHRGYQDAAPIWVDVPANGTVQHRPRLFLIPARDRPNAHASEGTGTNVQILR